MGIYRMYAFNLSDIVGAETHKVSESYTDQDLKLKEVKLGYNFLIDAYCTYFNIKMEDKLLIDGIVKFALPENEELALDFCKKGIEFKGQKYIGWFASTGMMKMEDYNEESKVEMLFINQSKKDFITYFENLITLVKVNELEGKSIKICKDYLSRLSLATSTSTKVKYEPNIIILPELEYTHVANYKSAELVDGQIVLKDYPNHPASHVFMDGMGLMSNRLADEIQVQMKLDYQVNYCIFRHYAGLAMKGGLLRVDFEQFFEEYYTEDSDTFRKIDDTFEVKDIFGKWRNLHEADIICSESCAKFYKNWKGQSMKTINDLVDGLKDKDKKLLNAVYITKVNKKEPKKMSLANYQLLGNLSLTYEEMQQLSSYTENIYREILHDNVDTLKLFLNDIVKQDIEESEPEEVVPSTKIKALLSMSEKFINLGYVQKNKARLINKKVRELCGGKFYIDADWKYMIADPISFMWTIMHGNNKNVVRPDFALKEEEFYIPNSNGEKIVLERCPLNCYNEVRKVVTVSNDVYKKYIPNCEELIVFNQADNLSLDGDFDGDICLVVKNDAIYNSVVEYRDENNDKWYFINFDDDKNTAVELEFNQENRYIATVKAGGNDICKLANYGLILSSQSTSTYKYVDRKDNTYTYKEAMDKIKGTAWYMGELAKIERISNKYERKSTKGKLGIEAFEKLQTIISNGNLVLSESKKDDLKTGLIDSSVVGFYLLRLQQLGIDKSKTLKPIPEEELEFINEEFKGVKKPYFLKYLKDLNGYNVEFSLNPMNMNARRIAMDLYREDIENMDSKDQSWMLYEYMNTKLEDNELDTFSELKEVLKDIYTTHNTSYNSIRMSHTDDNTKKIRYRQLDADTTLICKELEDKYGYRLIAFACVREKVSENFMIKYLWNTLQYCVPVDKSGQFVEDKDGKYEYLGKKYKKVDVKVSLSENLQSEQIKRAHKMMGNTTGETRLRLNTKISEGDILVVKDGEKEPELINKETGEVIGSIFVDKLQLTDTVNLKDVAEIKVVSIVKTAKTGKSATVIVKC